MDDNINYAFSSAFTMSPDGVPQPHVIPNDDDDEIDEVQWYTPAHAHQNISPNNVFVSANQQNHPNQFRMKLLTWISR